MTDLSIRARLALLLVLLLASMAVAAGFALYQLRGVTLSINTVYADRVVPLVQLRAVAHAHIVTLPSVVQQVRDGQLDTTDALAELDRARGEARQQWARYKTTYLVPLEKTLISRAEPLLARAEAAHDKLAELLRKRDTEGLRQFASHEVPSVVQPLNAIFDQLVALQSEEAAAETESSQAAFRAAVWGVLAMGGLALAAGAALAWATVLRYASERRAAEAQALHQAHCFAALSRTNQMILRAQDTETLFEEICRICVDTGLARVAFVLQLEGDRGVVVGSAGPAEELLSGILLKLETDGPMSSLPVAQALHQGVHVVSNDYLHDPRTTALHERASQQGVRAMGAFPVRRGGVVVGSLNLYVGELGFFDDARIRLLDEMVGDLSFALDNIDRDAARVRAEREVEAGYARMRRVFNLMPVAILLVSRKTGLVIEANATCGKRYGMAPEAMVGHSMAEMGLGFWPADRARFDAELEANDAVHEFEARVRVSHGSEVDLLTSAALIDYQGEPCRLSVSLDITERKRREQAERARFDAETHSRAKTDFLSRMSHELRTPLNAVLGFSQLLQSNAAEPLSARQRVQVESIRQAGWHLLALINDVLDVSRIESGHLRVEVRGVDLTAVLDEVFDLVRAQADTAGVRLDAAYREDEPAVVRADPLRLRQVLLNLASNAVKYNRRGGSVRVGVQPADERVVISMVDTGLGMTHEQLDQLFEPFNRLGREHSEIEGTGIGLVLTRQLLALMQGELAVESEAGRGTTVRVTLQQADAASQRGELVTRPAAWQAEPRSKQPEGVVLYIEDNPINLLIVEQLLLGWPGIRLVQAETGQQGLELAQSLQPDLVLLDMRLPDMTGPQILKAFQADPRTSGLRVVALSASAMPHEVALARRCGAFDYWTKPLDFDRFMADLKRLLAVTPA
ncbi:MAG: GAF domain-containing protein [Rhizobacter sp.]|nr:GAF domain-containing protein [Rhizobacter sp.]